MTRLRIGLGYDSHRLGSGRTLRLGGIDIPCDCSAIAVSDGDVLLHALVDALLGAVGGGDIGEMYPESAVARGEDSRRFLREVLALEACRGARIANVDCTVHLERPKLAPWKRDIRKSLAGLLGVEPERVNVKAKTAEGLGPVGEGRAVAAEVALLLELP